MRIDIESEKSIYSTEVNIDRTTYQSDHRIDLRIRRVFKSFARTLWDRGQLPDATKESEIRNLCCTTRAKLIHPLLSSDGDICTTQDEFDAWHRATLCTIKTTCPISWREGPILTVGMCQKIINLLSKDLWALNLVPGDRGNLFHAIIDQVTLTMLPNTRHISWTRLDSYQEYMQLQLRLRRLSQRSNTYLVALECQNWNRDRLARKRLRSA